MCNILQCFCNGFSHSFVLFFSLPVCCSRFYFREYISTIHFYECLNTLKPKVDKWKSELATKSRTHTPTHNPNILRKKEKNTKKLKAFDAAANTHKPLAATSRLEQTNACMPSPFHSPLFSLGVLRAKHVHTEHSTHRKIHSTIWFCWITEFCLGLWTKAVCQMVMVWLSAKSEHTCMHCVRLVNVYVNVLSRKGAGSNHIGWNSKNVCFFLWKKSISIVLVTIKSDYALLGESELHACTAVQMKVSLSFKLNRVEDLEFWRHKKIMKRNIRQMQNLGGECWICGEAKWCNGSVKFSSVKWSHRIR